MSQSMMILLVSLLFSPSIADGGIVIMMFLNGNDEEAALDY